MSALRLAILAVAALACAGRANATGEPSARAQSAAAVARGSSAATCFNEAAARYRVDERLLRAIARVESNLNPAAIHQNTDGSHDVGMMQINSSHFVRLQGFGITEATLIEDPCTNITVGAWLLSGFIRQFGPTWRAVGAYATGVGADRDPVRVGYVAKVQRALAQMPATVVKRAPVHMLVVD